MLARLQHEAGGYLLYLLPWGFQTRLFHHEPSQVALAVGGCALQALEGQLDLGKQEKAKLDDAVKVARGKHSVSYRLRAEIPGKFSALPAKASAMYAPELKGNSDEIKLTIKD